MKYYFPFACILLLTISQLSHGQDTTPLKRTPYKLTIAVDKKTQYEENVKADPYVYPDNTIQLYPGETVYIEVKQTNGKIEKLTAVKEIRDSANTVTISFSQSAEKKIHKLMMLRIDNPFSSPLVYKAVIFLLKKENWVDTNVYPVPPKLSAFETWPDVIMTIGLSDWKFTTN